MTNKNSNLIWREPATNYFNKKRILTKERGLIFAYHAELIIYITFLFLGIIAQIYTNSIAENSLIWLIGKTFIICIFITMLSIFIIELKGITVECTEDTIKFSRRQPSKVYYDNIDYIEIKGNICEGANICIIKFYSYNKLTRITYISKKSNYNDFYNLIMQKGIKVKKTTD